MTASVVDFSFPHRWTAEILATRPLILPPRHFMYPREVEEIEHGALEVLIRPGVDRAELFLATCALGFRDSAVPTGLWSAPNPDEICAVSGGYAYIINATAPERFAMVEHRPVLEVRPAVDARLLLFVGHRSILAWGPNGQAWESEKLSDEGVSIDGVDGGVLRGRGWEMMADAEKPFVLDLTAGRRLS